MRQARSFLLRTGNERLRLPLGVTHRGRSARVLRGLLEGRSRFTLEVVVHANSDRVTLRVDLGSRVASKGGERLLAEVIVDIFGLGRPSVGERELHAATQCPARLPMR